MHVPVFTGAPLVSCSCGSCLHALVSVGLHAGLWVSEGLSFSVLYIQFCSSSLM